MKDIIRDGNPTLRKEAAKVTFPLSDEDRQLAHDMMEYLINSQDPEIAEKQHEIDHLHGILFYDHINKKSPFTLKDPDTVILE